MRIININRQLAKGAILSILYFIICAHESYSLSLSPVEKLLFQSRLSNIQSSIEQKFPSLLVSSSSCSSLDEKKENINNTNIILIFPGAGGIDDLVIELLESINNHKNSDTLASIVDWKEYRGSILSAGYDSEKVGESIADCIISKLPEGVETVHSIGISVGSFAANAFATSMKNSSIYTRLTLLDPFCLRGIWGTSYGSSNFGKDIDYTEHYLNTDDPVPSTNDPLLRYCSVIDVTNAKERDDFIVPDGDTMHSWPVAYYSRYVLKNDHDRDYAMRRFYYGENGYVKGSIKKL